MKGKVLSAGTKLPSQVLVVYMLKDREMGCISETGKTSYSLLVL